MGGAFDHTFEYDNFNRLTGGGGWWLENDGDNAWDLEMTYGPMHRITSKKQEHTLDALPVNENTYDHDYSYGAFTPNALSAIAINGNQVENLLYDLNGNVTYHHKVAGESRHMAWDESNRLKAVNIAGAAIQHAVYDATGERALKGHGTVVSLGMNGKKYQYAARMGNYVRYVSGYSVVDRYGQLSKHYYAGSERIASRLAGPSTAFVDAEDLAGDHVDALPALQQMDIRIPVQGWGIGLGQGSFENVPLPVDICGNYEAGSEEHKQCICEQEGTCPDVIYWYHPDHLGSSTFLTDRAGQPYQFVMYLPFGETFAEQRAAGFGTPYLFNAKELDEETGLYYYGARYYDPRVSMWWGVDPMAEKYPEYSPYTYTLNNPVRYIDPDGNRPYDVILSGPQALQAFNELKASSSLTLSFDSQTGKLAATGKANNKADKQLLRAINDKNRIVNLITTKANIYDSKDGVTDLALTPGGFEGSIVNPDGKVVATQLVNVENARIVATIFKESTGETLRHEINEAYIGAKQNPGGDYNSAYESAHNAAFKLDGSKENHDALEVNYNRSNNTLEIRKPGDTKWISLGKIEK